MNKPKGGRQRKKESKKEEDRERQTERKQEEARMKQKQRETKPTTDSVRSRHGVGWVKADRKHSPVCNSSPAPAGTILG